MTKHPHKTVQDKNGSLLPSWIQGSKLHYVLLILIPLILYANTFNHDYAQDDAIVIYDNMFTQQGIKGIPGLFSNDSFFGFFKDKSKATLVEGGRYRPFTLAMFAVEYELFGHSPKSRHILNVLWYILLGLLLYHFTQLLFRGYIASENISLFALLVSIVFLAHPIHTEVVANIKGRDEIMSLFFSITSFILILKNLEKPNISYLAGASLLFFAGLLSKENTITFLAIIPVGLILFRHVKLKKAMMSILPLIVVSIVFILIRYSILGQGPAQTGIRDLMNNPFVKWNGSAFVPFDWSEKYATITYTLGKYIQLLIFPHPLTHDYYPRQIPIMQWANWQVLLSLICYAGLVFGAIVGYKKRKLFSFSVFFFIASLSIISNLIFPVGTNMAERFMFMPSLAFALLIGYLIFKLIDWKQISLGISLFSVLLILYGWKTIDRNQVWKDDYTLFTTDVLTSVNSAKVLNAAGGALSTSVVSLDDEAEKTKRIQQAIGYLNRAIEIHPRYRNAYLLLGNCYYYAQEFDKAIEYYDQTLIISPGYPDALKNRRTAYRDAGRYYGEKMGDLNKALFYLKKAYEEMPEDIETIRLLGVCQGLMKNHDEAISLFKKWTELAPENAYAWRNLTAAYGAKGDEAQAALAQAKAISLDPEIFSK